MRSPRRSPARRAVSVVVTLVLACSTATEASVTTVATEPAQDSPTARAIPKGTHATAPIIVAAGDVAAGGVMKYRTAERAAQLHPDRVIVMGDTVYDSGTLTEYRTRWRPSWGRFDDRVWPVPGNHEWRTPGAAGFRYYFGVARHTWWARRAGAWLIVGLDSEQPSNARQERFLRRRLAENDGRPTIVVWHRPRYSSGLHLADAGIEALWRIASSDPDVRIALWGHDHDYEHMAIPVAGRSTAVHGFVVGTGGASLRGFTMPATPYTLRRIDGRYGVLRLRLGVTRWSWAFVRADGVVADHGHRHIDPSREALTVSGTGRSSAS